MKIKYTFLLVSIVGLSLISCDKQVVTEVAKNTEIESGKIFIDSNPRGMKIFYDKKNMGVVTPDSVFYLAAGEHSIALKHNIYLDSSFTTNIDYTNVESYSIDLMKNPKFYCSILCGSQPNDSKIYLNNNFTGFTTPAKLTKLYPGRFVVKFTKEMCREDSVILNLKSNDHVDINMILEDTTISVNYRKKNCKIFSDVLTKVVVDANNHKWVGTLDKGLMEYDGKNWILHENKEYIKNNHITDILIDSRQRMWVGTPFSLAMRENGIWKDLTDLLPQKYVYAVVEDKLGNIWVGTSFGLLKYSDTEIKTYTKKNSYIPDYDVTCIAAAPDGAIWFGTLTAGPVRFDGTNFQMIGPYSINPDISSNIESMGFDSSGRLYVYHLGNSKEKTISIMTRYDGKIWIVGGMPPLQFPVETVSFNANGDDLWLSTKQGLVKYTPLFFAKIFNTVDYSFYDKECTSSCVDKNSDVWVTTAGGGIVKIKKGNY